MRRRPFARRSARSGRLIYQAEKLFEGIPISSPYHMDRFTRKTQPVLCLGQPINLAARFAPRELPAKCRPPTQLQATCHRHPLPWVELHADPQAGATSLIQVKTAAVQERRTPGPFYFLLCMGLFSRFCVRALRCAAEVSARYPGHDIVDLDRVTLQPRRSARIQCLDFRPFQAGHVALHGLTDAGLQICEMAVARRKLLE
jgi:hypothetical protein